MNAGPRVLVVADDRHVERELRDALRLVASRGHAPTVLTSDVLLAMRLSREQIDARAAADCLASGSIRNLDSIALSSIDAALDERRNQSYADLLGSGLAANLEYSLIPTFMRAVRHVAVLESFTSPTGVDSLMVVGSGPLAQAAVHVAAVKRLRMERLGARPWQRLRHALARLHAGRHVRWVGSEFRSLVLEPGFLLLLYAKGLWRRLLRPSPSLSPNALILTGDRWTAAVVDHLNDPSRTLVLAGATQPGRALFGGASRLVPIESFAKPSDVVKGIAAIASGIPKAWTQVPSSRDTGCFTVNGITFWPLVANTFRMHLVVWIPVLRHLRSLIRRVSHLCPNASLLTSGDAPTYARTLIAVARECGIPSTSIQHGLMGEPNGHSIVRADAIAAWGSATEPWHRQHAPQTARFIVTGYPPFDSLAARALYALPLPRTARPFTVVVCTSFIADFSVSASESANLAMLEAVLDWARRGDVRVVQKMHPGEEPSYYATAAAALGWSSGRFTMTNEPILHDLLESSDLLVTAYSSTALESVMLGTPVIVCDFTERHLLSVDRVPGVTIAYSIDELSTQLDAARVAERPDRDSLASSPQLAEYIAALDGRAAERVAALVKAQRSSQL